MLKAPPPLWALALLAAFYFLSELPVFAALPQWRSEPAGLALLLLGVALPSIAANQFRAAGTQILPTSEKNDALVTSGLYNFTRNPMYLGVITASLGVAWWFGRPLMFLAPACIFAITNFALIPFEEAKMRRQFGAAFDDYCKRVRRWV
ncbi:MAG: isoprenylcysteine carboxylmethyltransferase family protein [Terricaulis sp.]